MQLVTHIKRNKVETVILKAMIGPLERVIQDQVGHN